MLNKTQVGILVVAMVALLALSARAAGLQVTTFAGTAGTAGTTDGSGSGALFNGPGGVAVGISGNVYVADTNNHTIRKITSDGTVITFAGTAGTAGSKDGQGITAQFNSPAGLAVDDNNNIIVADKGNNTIRLITSGGAVSTLAGVAGSSGNKDGIATQALFSGPSSVAADSSGNVYVADTFNNTIRKITPSTSGPGTVATLAGTAGTSGSADGTGAAAQFSSPAGVAVDRNGIVYVADSGNDTIRAISTTGLVTTFAGVVGLAAGANGTQGSLIPPNFNSPTGLAVDNAGNIVVADKGNNTIRLVSPTGVALTIAGVCPGGSAASVGSADGIDLAARFNGPSGVTVDSNGTIYIADNGNDTIRKGVTATPNALRIELDWDVPTDLDLHIREPNGNVVYYANTTSQTAGTWLTDNTGGTGPEMMGWTNLPGGTYEFWAVNYAGSKVVNFIITVYQNGQAAQTLSGTLQATAGLESQHAEISVLGANSGADGVQNIATGTTVVNPMNDMGISVIASNGGVVELSIDTSLLHALYDVSTAFGGIGQTQGTVPGYTPAWKFDHSSVYVAHASAFTAGTTDFKGHARRTLAIGQQEIDGTTNFTAAPSSNKIVPKALKAKLSLSLAQSAAVAKVKNLDSVTFSGQVELPVGLKLPTPRSTDTLDLALGIGNIIDHVVVDNRGRTKSTGDAGNIKKVSVRLPRPDKKTGLTFGTVKQRTATVTVTLSGNGFVPNGFDTEGVAAAPASSSLKIQAALIVGGITYENTVTAGIKVTKKQDFASLVQSKQQ